MNQQLIFNNDFCYDPEHQAIRFSCLHGGLKVNCFIPLPPMTDASLFLAQVNNEAFYWEDSAEQAILDDAFNLQGDIWL